MKRVTWTDGSGRIRVSLVPDDLPDSEAEHGLPLDPPDVVGCIDWQAVQADIASELATRRLLTLADLQREQGVITAIVTATVKRAIVGLFRQVEREEREAAHAIAEETAVVVTSLPVFTP